MIGYPRRLTVRGSAAETAPDDCLDTPHPFRITVTAVREDRAMGRNSKGPRALLGTRPSTTVATAARRRQTELGYQSMSDYLAALIAADVQMPDQAPQPVDRSTHEELPIADVA